MPRNPGNDYDIEAFKRLCKEALLDLPEAVRNSATTREIRREAALQHLLSSIETYTGSRNEKNFYPQEASIGNAIRDQIIVYLEHEWSLTQSGLGKKRIIDEYVEKALA